MISMTSTIFWKGKGYACEFVKNVKVYGEKINGQFRIYISRCDKRAFLVDEFNKVIAQSYICESWRLDALLDEEDDNYDIQCSVLCSEFAISIYEEKGIEVIIYNS